MRPIDSLTQQDVAGIRYVVFDLDDTFFERGKLLPEAYEALFQLSKAGIGCIPLTGRPSAYAELAARCWPVPLAIAENGGIACAQPSVGRLLTLVRPDPSRTERLALLRAQVTEAIPELLPSDDCHLRVTDCSFDVNEHVSLSPQIIDRGLGLIRSLGARATVSSVHLHGSFEPNDKASGAVRWISQVLGLDHGLARSACFFVGDSGNDAPCFSFFQSTCGVANVGSALGRLSVTPRWVTKRARAAGFVEFSETFLRRYTRFQ